MKDTDFCTCKDFACPCHPSNHDKGCTPCILKNRRQKEIPACFFKDIECQKPTDGWRYEDFAELVKTAKDKGVL